MTHILFLLSISLLMFAVLKVIRKRNNAQSFSFEGDVDYNPGEIQALRKLSALAGDIEDGDYDIDGDIDALQTALTISGAGSKSVFGGDIDDIEDAIEDDDFQGGLFSKLKKRRAEKKAKKVGFKPNLIARKAVADVLKTETKIPTAVAKINQINAVAKTPGAILATVDVAKVQVTGGRVKQSETDLKIPGINFSHAVVLWEQYYPGLSRSTTQVSAGANLTYTFVEPSAGDVTQVQVILITLAGNELNKIKSAEMTLSVTGKATDATVMASTRDRIELFTNDSVQLTTIVYIPTKKIKETLFAVPYASPTTADPIVVVLGGVPTGVSATVRLAGIDSEDWKSYKAMVGLS